MMSQGTGIEELLRNARLTNFSNQTQRWRGVPASLLDIFLGDLQRDYYRDRLDRFKKEAQVIRR